MDTLTRAAGQDNGLIDAISLYTRANDFAGYFTPDQVNALLQHADSMESLLYQLLPVAQGYSHPAISQFHVGAAALGHSGAIYLGANHEFAGQPLNQSVHAEQSAISNAWHHGESGLTMLAVTDAPCGHCRQFINELKDSGKITILLPDHPPMAFRLLLPHSFGPENLDVEDHLMAASPHPLHYDGDDAIVARAHQAAMASYAPYSQHPAAIALVTDRGCYLGRSAENCAYNPSLPPLQAAINTLKLAGDTPDNISRAVLVESRDAKISHADSSRQLLAGITDVPLEIVCLGA